MVRDVFSMLSLVKEKIHFYELFENILIAFWSKIISHTIRGTLCNISCLFLGVAIQNMTESHIKAQLTMSMELYYEQE